VSKLLKKVKGFIDMTRLFEHLKKQKPLKKPDEERRINTSGK
jgi:hypothetical protein